MRWKTSRREFEFGRTLLMGILNVTPDSFSDGGRFLEPDYALRRVETMIADGADIIDVGGESTRPNGGRVAADEETARVVPVIGAIARRFDIAVSVDTSKSVVARAAIGAGAEIVNDISGFAFDPDIAGVCAEAGVGVVLMHLRGTFETMHRQDPVDDIIAEVGRGWRASIGAARSAGIGNERIALDIGLGFSKSYEQNLELIAKLDKLERDFAAFPILVGASRKSFIGRTLGNAPVGERLGGSLAAAAIAVWNGARIVRAHDVAETAKALKLVGALKNEI